VWLGAHVPKSERPQCASNGFQDRRHDALDAIALGGQQHRHPVQEQRQPEEVESAQRRP
jgi:hypothetical protein